MNLHWSIAHSNTFAAVYILYEEVLIVSYHCCYYLLLQSAGGHRY